MTVRRRQSGQALIELVVAVAVALALTVWAAGYWAQQLEQQAIGAMAQWLGQLQRATQAALLLTDPSRVPQPLTAHGDALRVWVDWLKQAGHLPQAFQVFPSLPYTVSVEQVTPAGDCSNAPCASVWLVLAIPRPGTPESQRDGFAQGLLAALPGQALAVSSLAPQWLQGAAYRIANPPDHRPAWPLGSVAVIAWRSDVPPPFVRLAETRPVTLLGGLTVQGDLHVDGVATATRGFVPDQRVAFSTACAPEGRLVLAEQGGLAICQAGHWQPAANSVKRDFRACLEIEIPWGTWGPQSSLLPFWEKPDVCHCAPGYLPRHAGDGLKRLMGIPVYEGYVCEKV